MGLGFFCVFAMHCVGFIVPFLVPSSNLATLMKKTSKFNGVNFDEPIIMLLHRNFVFFCLELFFNVFVFSLKQKTNNLINIIMQSNNRKYTPLISRDDNLVPIRSTIENTPFVL